MELPALGLRVVCGPVQAGENSATVFTVQPVGAVILRCRQSGDKMRLPGGTKSLKKIFIDRKIPARDRCRIPVAADEQGVLGVYGIGVNMDRAAEGPAFQIRFEDRKKREPEE